MCFKILGSLQQLCPNSNFRGLAFYSCGKGGGGLALIEIPPYTHTLFIDVSVPRQGSERSCM